MSKSIKYFSGYTFNEESTKNKVYSKYKKRSSEQLPRIKEVEDS
jgi:hypothetical protein